MGRISPDPSFKSSCKCSIASAGDYSAPARYPATSPYVIAAGGTSIRRDAAGNNIDQVAWLDTSPDRCDPLPCKTGVMLL